MSEASPHPPVADDARLVPLVPGLLLFALLIVLGNAVSPLIRYPEIGSAVLYPPYALLTAALMASPRRDWVWYLLVAAAAHTVTHWPTWTLSWVLLADVANIARALVAASLLRRWFARRLRLDGLPDLARFVAGAVLVAPAVGATIGAANVVLHGASPTYWLPWLQWFMASALTGLTMLPLLGLAVAGWAARERWRADRSRRVEALLLAVALALTCKLGFLAPGVSGWDLPLRFYLPLPVLIWAALRFGAGGASVVLTVVAVVAIWGADRGLGPFLAQSPDDNILGLQVFLLLTTFPALCLAAVAGARQSALELHRALLLSLQDQVAVVDAEGIVLEVNDSWRRFAETAGARSFDPARPGEDYLEAVGAAAAAGDPIAAQALAGVTQVLSGESRRYALEYDRDGDGHREWYTMTAEALERSAGGAVITRANITARRRAQLEIEEQREAVRHLSRVALLGELSGALAHELGQPLASILTNAQAAGRVLRRRGVEAEKLTETLEDIVQDIVDEDRRASEVIHRLRALFKRGETRFQEVNAAELARDVLELAHAELIIRRVTATSAVEPGLPPVQGDLVQLQQVLLNLILNACEAMADTRVPDRWLALIVRRVPDNSVQFSISDRGTGIPAGILGRLFEPFVTTKANGLGLGLAISRTIVAAHGGRLWAENNAHGGASVHFSLSCAPAVAEPRTPEPSGLTVSPTPVPGPEGAASP